MIIYEEIRKSIEKEIYDGNFKEGMYYGTLKDICERFNVSKMTGYRAVQSLKNNGIFVTRKGSGIYLDNLYSLTEKYAQTNSILVIGGHFIGSASSYFSYRNEALIKFFQERKMGVKFIHPINSEQVHSALSSGGYKGVIMDAMFLEKFKSLKKSELPIVLYNNNMYKSFTSVNWNNDKIVQMACEYFERRSIRNIMVVAQKKQFFGNLFMKYFKGKIMNVYCIPNEYFIQNGIKTGQKILSEKLPDGMFISDDFTAMGMLLSLARARVNIPDEMEIVLGCAPNSLLANELSLPTFGCSPEKVGETAASALLELISNPAQKNKTYEVEPEVIVNETFKCSQLLSGVI